MALEPVSNRVNPATGLSLALYMVFSGVRLVWNNFRSLMDLSLTENEQLCMMRVLAAHYRTDSVGLERWAVHLSRCPRYISS